MSGRISITISPDFIHHVRKIYELALEEIVLGKVVRDDINGYTQYGLSGYIIAVSAVEAFVNEVFLSDWPRTILKDTVLWSLPKDWVEKLELGPKLVIVPQLLFGKSFSRDTQPYQDMGLLIKIRNDLVHYKMNSTRPKYIKILQERHIILPPPDAPPGVEVDYPWPSKLSCSEGIRWAHNTACATIQEMVNFAPSDSREKLMVRLASNFEPIPETYAKDWLRNQGIVKARQRD